jgi:hypothetical protein
MFRVTAGIALGLATLGSALRAQAVEAGGLPIELTVKPALVAVNSPVTFAGSLPGFTTGGNVSITVTPPEAAQVVLTAKAGVDGKFSIVFSKTSSIGKYRVRAVAPDGQGFVVDSFTVMGIGAVATSHTAAIKHTYTLVTTAVTTIREITLATTPSPPQQLLLQRLDQVEKQLAGTTAVTEEFNAVVQSLADVAAKYPEARPTLQPILDELTPMAAELEQRLPQIEKLIDGSKKLTQFCDDMVVVEETLIALTWALGVTDKMYSTLLNWVISKGTPAVVKFVSNDAVPQVAQDAASIAIKTGIKRLKSGYWIKTALAAVKDIMQVATREVFDVYCERFQGPVTAHLLVSLNQAGQPYLKYDIELAGKIVVNYAKDAKSTRIPVKGYIEGNATRFGLSENVALLLGLVEPKYRRPPTARLRFMPPGAPYIESLGMVGRMATPGYFNIPVNGELVDGKLILRIEKAAIDLSESLNKGKLVMIWLMSLPPFVHVETATVPLQNARFIIARGIVEPEPQFPITVDMAGNRSVVSRQFSRDHNDPGADIRVQFDVRVKACNPSCQ